MANHGPSYGLDAELDAKRHSQFDPALEKEVKDWIQSVTGDRIGDFHGDLKSGVILCKVANKIKPGSAKSSNAAAPFVQMENINSFLNFARGLGIPNPDLFMTVDLYENKNPNQVIKCLLSIKRKAGGGGSAAAKPPQVNLYETSSTPAPAASRAAPSYSSPSRAPAPASAPAPAPAAASGGANFCPSCGTKAAGAKFCSNCGTKL